MKEGNLLSQVYPWPWPWSPGCWTHCISQSPWSRFCIPAFKKGVESHLGQNPSRKGNTPNASTHLNHLWGHPKLVVLKGTRGRAHLKCWIYWQFFSKWWGSKAKSGARINREIEILQPPAVRTETVQFYDVVLGRVPGNRKPVPYVFLSILSTLTSGNNLTILSCPGRSHPLLTPTWLWPLQLPTYPKSVPFPWVCSEFLGRNSLLAFPERPWPHEQADALMDNYLLMPDWCMSMFRLCNLVLFE